MFRPASGTVNILDTKKELPTLGVRKVAGAKCNAPFGLGAKRVRTGVATLLSMIGKNTILCVFALLTSQYVQIGWQMSKCCNAHRVKTAMTTGEKV
jgi:hypothetical protein